MDIDYEEKSETLYFNYDKHLYSIKISKNKNELVFQMVFKTIINIYSNIVMALMDFYRNNIMTNLTACNTKLIGRICYFIEEFSGLSYYESSRIVFDLVLRLQPGQSIINNCLNFISFKKYYEDFENKMLINTSLKGLIIKKLFSEKISIKNIKRLEGGASENIYFRIYNPKCYDEKIKFDSAESFILNYSALDYNECSDYMKNRKIYSKEFCIPQLIYYSKNQSFLILKDCGNIDLTSLLLKNPNFEIYKNLIDIIIKLQKIQEKSVKVYDKQLIYSEMENFTHYFLSRFLEIKLSEEEINYLEQLYKDISTELYNSTDKLFCHKDFNSTNIMVYNNKYYILDFQSSLIGSRYYDLICLLTDDRIPFNEQIFQSGKKYYIENNNGNISEDEIKNCILHRHLKTLGLFSQFILKEDINILII